MPNALLGWVNLILSGTLTAGSQAPGLGIGNLKQERGAASTAWQTGAGVVTANGGAWFEVDSGDSGSVWNALTLARTNLTADARIEWLIGEAPTSGGLAWTSGRVPAGVARGYAQTVAIPPAGTRGRRLHVRIDDPGNPDGFVNIPLAFAGPCWEPALNLGWGSALGSVVRVTKTVTRGGQEYPTPLSRQRQYILEFVGIKDAEVWPYVQELDACAWAGGNILLVPRPDGPDMQRETVFGMFEPTAPLTTPLNTLDARAWRATITERL